MKKLLMGLFFVSGALFGDAPNAFDQMQLPKLTATNFCSTFDGSMSELTAEDFAIDGDGSKASWGQLLWSRYMNFARSLSPWLKGLLGLYCLCAILNTTFSDNPIMTDCKGMWDFVVGFYRRYQVSKLPSSLKDNIYGDIYNGHFIPEE